MRIKFSNDKALTTGPVLAIKFKKIEYYFWLDGKRLRFEKTHPFWWY